MTSADLKAEAYRYFKRGFNVVAIKYRRGKGGKVGKVALCRWGEWRERRQTLEEFNAQPWGEADAFAVVTSYPNDDGLYMAVVDYDAKGEVSEEAKARGWGCLPSFLDTRIERTVSGGLHFVYLSKVRPRAVKSFHKTHALELIGGGPLCVMAPSRGYEVVEGAEPKVVEDAESLFYEALGVRDEREGVNEGLPASLLEKWLKQILGSGKLRVAGEGPNYYYCRCPLQTHGGPDLHPSFVVHKSKFYGYCFKEGKSLNLRQLAEAVGVKLQPAAEEQLPPPTSVPPPFPELRPEEYEKPLTVGDLIQILGSTVKRDDENKVITFLSMLLTYTDADQVNVGFLAEASAGKSYIPLELSWYFPKEDVIKLGYASPTAFFHELGRVEADPSTGRRVIHVDLRRKILIFLDQPHEQLLQRVRSLLSHDEKEIMFKITDRRERAGLRTKTVVVHGFPTVIFCTAKLDLPEQEKTRLLLLSPEVSEEKLRESILLKIERDGDRECFLKRMLEDPGRRMLAMRVWSIRNANVKHVKVPEELRRRIYDRFLKAHRYLLARHQRDVARLLALIKGHALLNFMHRRREVGEGGVSILVNEEDVEEGFRLYSTVSEANELGLPPTLFNVFNVLRAHIAQLAKAGVVDGITIKEFQSLYASTFHRVISYEEARRMLNAIASAGLLNEEPDPADRRRVRYVLTEGEAERQPMDGPLGKWMG